MRLILDYFDTMTSGRALGIRTYKRDGTIRINTYHRFIQDFVPHSLSLGTETSPNNARRLVHPPFPLALTPAPTTIVSKLNKYPVILLANEHSNLANVIYCTDLWEFFSDDSSETSIGIPDGTPTSNVNIDAVIYNGAILTSHPTDGSLYHGAISGTPSWTAVTGSVTTGVTHVLKPFQDRCLVTDSSGGSFTRPDKVQIVKSDYTMVTGITLGDTFDIEDIAIFEERSVLLFCQKTTSPRLQRSTIVFLWDGVEGDQYDQKILLKGLYRCSIERDGLVYVFTQVGTTLICYVFDGAGFREIGSIRNILVSTNTGIPKSRIAIDGDFFVLAASSPGNTSADAPFYWNPSTRESFFLTGALNTSAPMQAVLIAQDPNLNIKRYGTFYDTSGTPAGYLVSFAVDSSTKGGNPKYYSNIIPTPTVKGIHDDASMGRMAIDHIEIEYNQAPPSSSDAIALSLLTKDAYESETVQTDTATISDTTAHSTNANVDTTRAIMDIGRNATEFEIDLTVTVATSSWDLVIRRIIIVFEPIALPI